RSRPAPTTQPPPPPRHAASCNSTSPPAGIRWGGADGTARVGGGGGGGGRTSGRNARLHAGRVVREVEVDAQFFHQVIVRVHTGEDALGSARIDQQIPERIIEAGQENRAAGVIAERHVDGVGVGREQFDAAGLERGRG